VPDDFLNLSTLTTRPRPVCAFDGLDPRLLVELVASLDRIVAGLEDIAGAIIDLTVRLEQAPPSKPGDPT
jgi:hypothetical protein